MQKRHLKKIKKKQGWALAARASAANCRKQLLPHSRNQPLRAAVIARRLGALQQEVQQLQRISTQLDTTLHHARSTLSNLAAQYAIDDDDW